MYDDDSWEMQVEIGGIYRIGDEWLRLIWWWKREGDGVLLIERRRTAQIQINTFEKVQVHLIAYCKQQDIRKMGACREIILCCYIRGENKQGRNGVAFMV